MENSNQQSGPVFEVRVTGINYDATLEEVKQYFEAFTSVKFVNLLKSSKGKSRGIAYIKLND